MLKRNWLQTTRLLFQILLSCLLGSFVFLIFSSLSLPLSIVANPFISAFIHVDFTHILINFLILGFALAQGINRSLGFRKFYNISFILSLLYFPFSCFNILPPCIGLSGVAYYLLTRYLWTRHYVWKGVAAILFLGEISQISPSSDTAHLMHVFGMLMGYRSCSQLILSKN
jgi:hypothetical protein